LHFQKVFPLLLLLFFGCLQLELCLKLGLWPRAKSKNVIRKTLMRQLRHF